MKNTVEDNRVADSFVASLFDGLTPAYRYDGNEPAEVWQRRAYARLWELLGLDYMLPCDDDGFEIIGEFDLPDGHAMEFAFQSEPGYVVPGYILLPHGWQGEALPVCICLQGHSTGVHNSLAMYPDRTPMDDALLTELIRPRDRDFMVRAVKEGYVAIGLEQRYMGRRGTFEGVPGCNCGRQGMSTRLLGRTPIGERVWDVMRLIDALERHVPFADTARLVCMGNSGGGTATFYAACLEQRIRYAVPSCAFCTYKDSIVDIIHCSCNYIPGIARDFDMGDLAGLIAPRSLVIVNGDEDDIFPDHGVRKAYAVAERMFEAFGGQLTLVTGHGGHRFYADAAWAAVHRFENA